MSQSWHNSHRLKCSIILKGYCHFGHPKGMWLAYFQALPVSSFPLYSLLKLFYIYLSRSWLCFTSSSPSRSIVFCSQWQGCCLSIHPIWPASQTYSTLSTEGTADTVWENSIHWWWWYCTCLNSCSNWWWSTWCQLCTSKHIIVLAASFYWNISILSMRCLLTEMQGIEIYQ